ncbi:MAG: preprotein translocase subunit YajC [Ruminococcus sp.]|nr:preprotein translocase subunit YajC [Ruminococcus sp.]MCD7800000.1 preprotein translocase subunit YajC [Ruminococcus sp.]
MNLTNLITLTADSTTESTSGTLLASFLPMIVILVIFYFLLIRPQNKKEKETKQMRDNVQIGDEICTIGGIVGIVIRQSEDTVVIETGGERNKLRVKKWAIQENLTQHEEVQAEVTPKEEKKKKNKNKKSDDMMN